MPVVAFGFNGKKQTALRHQQSPAVYEQTFNDGVLHNSCFLNPD
ncbi:MAG: hypothetical protein BWX77_00092 [Bacteroidetes bacterium ADurb.Bin090]|nr:MAG: hypothetical protein BWX77_00092 [Bacteroidetes bacterium ADurb.Bin090]